MERKKRPRHRQPFWIPLAGVLALAGLLFFQRKHERIARMLAAAAPAAIWTEIVKDPLSGPPLKGWLHCPSPECGRAFPLGTGLPAGQVEFDLLPPSPGAPGEAFLFEITAGDTGACPAPLPVVRLAMKSRRLYLTVKPDGAEGKALVADLPGETAAACRLLCEWGKGKAALFVNGSKAAAMTDLKSFGPGTHSIRVYDCANAASLGALRVLLLR